MTPFMLAVSGRAYPAAITVLEAAQKMAKGKLISHSSAFGKLIVWVIAELLMLTVPAKSYVQWLYKCCNVV